MKRKFFALCFAVMLSLSVVCGSISAFAATDESSSSSDTLSEFLEDVFDDWEAVPEDAIELRDAYYEFLCNITSEEGLSTILGLSQTVTSAVDIPVSWLKLAISGLYAITPYDNIYYWLTNGKLVFDDRTSGESIQSDVDVTAPTVYIPTPWIEIITAYPKVSTSSDIGEIVDTVSTGVGGVFEMASAGFGFLTDNALCMFMIAVSFAGVGIGFIGRAFKTSRR